MGIRIHAAGHSDVGRTREQNEDSFLVDPELGLYIVADGMGGHQAGEVASATAVRIVREVLATEGDAFAPLDADDATPVQRREAQAVVERAVLRACAEIHAMGRASAGRRGMGTTFDCLCVTKGGFAIVAHVGDSRVYRVTGGRAQRLTDDHSLVEMQVKAGVITREQAAHSEWRNVLLYALGVQASVPVDTLVVECAPGDRFVMCSDGLHGLVSDEELAQAASDASVEPEALARSMVDLANERGGPDNVTVIVVDIARGEATPAEDAGAMREILAGIPLFAGLTYREQATVLSLASPHRYPVGEQIVREGSPSEDVYIVVGGVLSVAKDGVRVADVTPGGTLGEMSLLRGSTRSATVTVTGDTPARVLQIDRGELLALMRREPRLAVKLLWTIAQTLSDRLRRATHEIVQARRADDDDAPFVAIEE